MNLVVGGGLMGTAVALELARRGRDVTVLEKAVTGAEASSAAGGILAPRFEAHGDEALRELGVASLALYPDWAASLGEDVGFRRSGLLVIVHPGEKSVEPDRDAEWADAERARGLEPGLAPDLEGAWWLPDEAVLDTRRLVAAVKKAAVDAGVRFREHAEVKAVHADAVELAAGERLAGAPVLCAGAWTSKVPGFEAVPIRPVRGQMVAIEAPGIVRHVIFGVGGYVVPRADEVVVGSTMEEVGYTRGLTARGLGHVLHVGMRHVPRLADFPFLRAWSAFRPGSPDAKPILGRVNGVWVASGHFRNGILLAPYTAQVMADAICDGAPLPESCRPDRF